MPAIALPIGDAYRIALAAKHSPPAGWPDIALVESARQVLAGAVTATPADALDVRWTTWPNVKETNGDAHAGTWRSLTGIIDAWAFTAVPTKLAAPGWAPARFAHGRRHDDSVEALYALALDCDDHGEWTRMLAALSDLGLAYLAHRTPGHSAEACKWRLVLPLVRPVDSLEVWRDWYTAARVVLGAVGGVWYDPSCSNPSRLWYPPIKIGHAPTREVLIREGMAIDLSLIAEAVGSLVAIAAPRLPMPSRPGRLQVVATPLERARKWLGKRDPAIAGSGGDHQTFVTACAMVIDFALSEADAFSALGEWNARCVPPWSDADLRAKIAHAAKYGSGVVGSALDAPIPMRAPDMAGEVWTPPVQEEAVRYDEAGDPVKRRDRIRWVKLTDKGAPVACLENTRAMLDHYAVKVRYNLMTHEDEYEAPSLQGAADKRQNASVAQIREWARKHGMPAGPVLDDHLTLMVEQAPYHPAGEWIESRPWDGVDRLDALFSTLGLATEDVERVALTRRLFQAWCATVARAALVPAGARQGVASQLVLVIQGPQGVRKTRWIESLAPQGSGWVRTGVMLDPSQRDSVQQATNVWICELGELDATFRKADVAALKAHLTSRTDTYRAAYARKAETVARRTVYAATVNERGVLADDTGSRRFAVVSVIECNPEHGIDMQQVWAQAAMLPPSACFLSGDDERKMLEVNREHETSDPMAELLAQGWEVDNTDTPGWKSLKTILEGIDQHRQWSSSDSKSIARALKNRLKARTRVKDGYTLFAVARRPE